MFHVGIIMKVIIHNTIHAKPKKTMTLMEIARLLRQVYMYPFVRIM